MAFAILKSSMPFEPDIGLGLTNSNPLISSFETAMRLSRQNQTQIRVSRSTRRPPLTVDVSMVRGVARPCVTLDGLGHSPPSQFMGGTAAMNPTRSIARLQ
jgi:hypothetical protein